MKKLLLKPGREKSLQRRHPWVFSGAVARVDGDPEPGDTVELRSATGGFLGWGAWSPQSQIAARLWDVHERTRIDEAFFAQRLDDAVTRRAHLLAGDAREAIRLVHGESDGLPGVTIDRFADWLVVQLTSAGAWRWRDAIVDAARQATGLEKVFERSDGEVLTLEGLTARVGAVSTGVEPPDHVEIEEAGLVFGVDVRRGHKTGFYLDQRDNRALVRDLATDREVLDCFSYTGGFALNALAGGAASVTAVDSSADALVQLRHHAQRNALPDAKLDTLEADVFQCLRRFRDQGRQFDLIVLDPPKFAPTQAMAERAARGYKDINLWALKLLKPSGVLFTFSCSGGVNRAFFQQIVAGAAVDAGVDAYVLHHMTAAADHPVRLTFPEGEYLKGLMLATD
jgi:23S rRNA (cytosine1962-C5)-methyltransferase